MVWRVVTDLASDSLPIFGRLLRITNGPPLHAFKTNIGLSMVLKSLYPTRVANRKDVEFVEDAQVLLNLQQAPRSLRLCGYFHCESVKRPFFDGIFEQTQRFRNSQHASRPVTVLR